MYEKNLNKNIQSLVKKYPDKITVYDQKLHGMMTKNALDLNSMRGVWVGLPEESYRQILALSCSSGIKSWMTKSPLTAAYEMGIPIDGDGIIEGTACDKCFFDRDLFLKTYVGYPKGVNGQHKAGKEFKAEKESEGFTILSSNDYKNFNSFGPSIRADKNMIDFWKNCIPQIAIIVDVDIADTETGECETITVKGMLDMVDFTGDVPTIWDLKSTSDIGGAESQIWQYGYDIQLALYREFMRIALGIDRIKTRLLFWDKKEPHDGRIIEPSGIDLNNAKNLFYRAMSEMLKCNEKNYYPRNLIITTSRRPNYRSLGEEKLSYSEGEKEMAQHEKARKGVRREVE